MSRLGYIVCLLITLNFSKATNAAEKADFISKPAGGVKNLTETDDSFDEVSPTQKIDRVELRDSFAKSRIVARSQSEKTKNVSPANTFSTKSLSDFKEKVRESLPKLTSSFDLGEISKLVRKNQLLPHKKVEIPKSKLALGAKNAARQTNSKIAKDAEQIIEPQTEDESIDSSEKSANRKANVSDELTNGIKVEDIVEQAESYRYSGTEKADPFQAPIHVVEAAKIQTIDSEEIPIISPLQYHDLKALLVTGVWESEKGKWKAMIETPDKQGIITKLHDAVGNSAGRVTAISPNGVVVREYKLRKDGTQEFSDKVIVMSKESDSGDKFLGGKIILTPGESQPTVKRPDDDVVQAPTPLSNNRAVDSTKLALDKEKIEKPAEASTANSMKTDDLNQIDSPAKNVVPMIPASTNASGPSPTTGGGQP